MKMKTRFISLCVILGFWSYAASAADAPPAARPPAPAMPKSIPADVPAAIGAEACLSDYSGASCPSTGGGSWWRDRIKPALQYGHWGYTNEFEEIPFGARVRAHQQAQLCSGTAARLWLYQYDFCDGGATLNPAGHKRLIEMAGAFPVWSHHCLVIEATPGNSQLDAARRDHVAQLLEAAGAPAPVQVGVPRVSAPFGDETREWNKLFMSRIRSGSSSLGGSSGGSSSGGSSSASSGQ
jgi:hypothetical protein